MLLYDVQFPFEASSSRSARRIINRSESWRSRELPKVSLGPQSFFHSLVQSGPVGDQSSPLSLLFTFYLPPTPIDRVLDPVVPSI